MKILSNMRISNRLTFGFALVLVLAILSTSMALYNARKNADATRQMMEIPLAKERLVADWFVLTYSAVVRTSMIARSSDAELSNTFKDDIDQSVKSGSAIIKKIEPLLSSDEEKALMATIIEARKKYQASKELVMNTRKTGDAAASEKAYKEVFEPAAKDYGGKVNNLLAEQRNAIDKLAADIDASSERSMQLMVLLSVLLVTIGAVAVVIISRSITAPLKRALDVAKMVAAGDLSAHIEQKGRDEIAELMRALGEMNNSLRSIVSEVQVGTESITTAAGEIASGNFDLSSRTEQQAGSLEETAASIEELTSTVKQNAENAQQANQLAMDASDVAKKGSGVVSQVVQTMSEINHSSNKIVDIISVIDGIAFQTNILALNAAVEAARAGEQGRGFAVVASEVRSLAQRSAAAAKEIKQLIDNSVEKVDAGSKLVNEAGATMGDVVESIKRVTDIMGEISVASREQSSGIEQISRAVTEIDDATQQNAALVEEATATSDMLRSQAQKLADAGRKFRLGTPVVAAGAARHGQPERDITPQPLQLTPSA
ncbi:MCP four helix bundle domain-containing protein [Herbaspirillum sp. LeCh32-8]|uniref:methyl-accepting chemotaxis protein n=1 Tax=Herbaspirillum sp. LeCh32-8 TaxID=2821356 RepID=UPI001AE4ECDE|nr:methyl-accepting chemotaxis protein [Herbaspirillum sp. LeCh32-8]MBP0599026.1 MCP four helix bundle domain-containing protein [Herbaspirillum sp. LeCh32-8]